MSTRMKHVACVLVFELDVSLKKAHCGFVQCASDWRRRYWKVGMSTKDGLSADDAGSILSQSV